MVLIKIQAIYITLNKMPDISHPTPPTADISHPTPPGTLFKCDFLDQIMRYRMSQKSEICGKNAEKTGKYTAKMRRNCVLYAAKMCIISGNYAMKPLLPLELAGAGRFTNRSINQ